MAGYLGAQWYLGNGGLLGARYYGMDVTSVASGGVLGASLYRLFPVEDTARLFPRKNLNRLFPVT